MNALAERKRDELNEGAAERHAQGAAPGRGRAKRLVVAVVSAESGVGRAVLRGIASAAARFGWTLENIDPAVTGDDFVPFAQILRAADGVIARIDENGRKARPFLGAGTPLVGIDVKPFSDPALWAVVVPDNVKIGIQAADELLSAGLACYALVPMLPKSYWGEARDKGFLDRIRAAGGDVRVYEPRETWREASEHDSLVRWLSGLPRPFGLFARNDVLAKFALGACKSAGIDVPGEARIVGADDDETICQYAVPPLSSVRIDHEGGGRRAAEALQNFFGRQKPARTATLRFGPLGVARRASTGAEPPDVGRRLALGLEFIARHFGNRFLGAGDVAAAMGLGRRQAERLFRAAGTSIHQKLDETRLARVKTLLATTDTPLRDIAEECGYSSGIYLSGLFRRRLGMTSGEYRERSAPDRSAGSKTRT